MGADGIKILGIDRDTMEAMEDEAHKLGLRVAHHAGVEETNAWDDIKFGTTSIEHWYGIPDAAIETGCRTSRPATTTTMRPTASVTPAICCARPIRNGSPRCWTRWCRRNVAWDPTLDIYEASRDLQRAQTQPWFEDYLHPALEKYFQPEPGQPRVVLHRLDFHRRSVLEGKLSPVDGGAALFRPARAG